MYTEPLKACGICGNIWTGVVGHSVAGEPADTEAHKAALAAKERASK